MAVSKVRKLELIAHAQCHEEIMRALREMGSVHISDIRELLPDSDPEPPDFLKTSLSKIQSKLDQVLYCSLFLERFIPKPSLIENLLRGKLVFTEHEVQERLAAFDLEGFYEECNAIETELAANESQIERTESLMDDVAHWLNLEWPLERIQNTATTRIMLGICEAWAFKPMTDELSELSSLYHIEIVHRSRTSVSMLMIYPRSLEDSLGPVLRRYGWRAIEFRGLAGKPADIVVTLREKIGELQESNRQLRTHVKTDLARMRNDLLLLYDQYTQELKTLEIQSSLLFTSHTFVVSGWVVESQAENLERCLTEITTDLDLRFSDPSPDDRVPIHLENHRFIQPFTLITEMYGHPQYREFDPTPFFAPFFVLFFAICLGDAGYGLILALGSYIALKKFKIYGGARKLLQILFIGGLANIVIGLLTGGVFTMESGKLPGIFKVMRVFSPTEQVVLFLYIAFALGVIQVLFGLGVKLVHNLREGDTVGAILDQGLWILFLTTLVPLVFKYIFGGSVSENIISPATNSALILAVSLVLTQGRKTKIFILRPIMGLFKLYNTMGYFSDVLSYARLMALGLATAFLGMAFNQMAEMSMGIPYGIGYVVAILILIFSHLFNLAINCLGAFVHSLRLQYLEFFSKFFVGGGEPFVPFAETREHTIIQSGLERSHQG